MAATGIAFRETVRAWSTLGQGSPLAAAPRDINVMGLSA